MSNIPLSALIIKSTNAPLAGLYKELSFGEQGQICRYGIVMYNPITGHIVVNKNLQSGSKAVQYIDSFKDEKQLEKIMIVISREPITKDSTRIFGYQPFLDTVNYHSLNYKNPVIFIGGNGRKSNGMPLTYTERDYILDAAINNPSYISMVKSNRSHGETFNSLKTVAAHDRPLERCMILGIFPSVDGKIGSVLYYNQASLTYSPDLSLFYMSNGYMIQEGEPDEDQSDTDDENDDSKYNTEEEYVSFMRSNRNKAETELIIKVREEPTDFSDLIKEVKPVPFVVGQLIQINCLTIGTQQPFSQLYEITYVNTTDKRLSMRRAFGLNGDIMTKSFAEIEDMSFDLFNYKLI